MLRVLTLSTLFPNAAQPRLGLFVERQTAALAARSDVALQVVAPRGIPWWPLSRHPHYAARAALPESENWNGLRLHRPRYPVVPAIGHRWTARFMAAALLPMLRRLRESFPFDVIDAEFFWPDGPAATRLGAALGVPVSIKARGSDIHLWGERPGIAGQIRAAAAAAGGLLAVSEALKADMVRIGMDGGRIRVHYTGVDFDLFRPRDRATAKAELGLDGPLIATVGALIPGKGQAIALRTVAAIPDATLILVGDGPDLEVLARLADQLGIAQRVRFAGSQPPDRVARLLAAADVMLLPSRAEGLANAWIEALACGTPVVTCDVGGAREAIAPESGRLVEREPGALAAAVRDLLEQPPDPPRLRASVERFSWTRNSGALFEHLSEVAGVRPAA